MRTIFCLLSILVCMTSVATAQKLNKDLLITQVAHNIVTSETAVACQLRKGNWRKAVILGLYVTTRIAEMSVHLDASDDDLDKAATGIMQAAKIQAAMDVKFAAPTLTECRALSTSRDMKNMDAYAHIGLLAGAVSQ